MIVGLAAFLPLSVDLPDVSAGKDKTLTVFYTGAVSGELEPCGCSPKTDFGGLPRRAGYLEAHRAELSPSILVDAGNFSGEDTPQGRLKAETMIQALGLMKYDAVALASQEKAFPPDLLSNWVRSSKLRVLRESGDGAMNLTPSGIRVHLAVNPGKTEKGSLNILLWDQTVEEALERSPDWDVVVLSDGNALEEPRSIGKTVVVSGYPKGEHLGILSLHLDDRGVASFDHRWEPLGVETPENEKMRALLKDYDGRVAALYAAEEANFKAQKGPYVGVEQCIRCHAAFVESWQKTEHANAWKTLEKAGKTQDPECTRCHSVGFGENGGFHSIGTTPSLAGVQCEVCHGPGESHLREGYGPMREIGESTCLHCHVPGHSPDFNYAGYRERILHHP
jgi:hypothetical protein